MIEYKIKEGSEELSAKEKVIVKTGDEVEFTLNDIETDVTYLEKNKKEITAQIGISNATMENVKGTHPHIAEMSKEDLTAAYLFREALGFVTAGEEKLAEIEKQLADYAKEKAEIETQFPELVVAEPAPAGEGRTVEEAEKAAVDDGSKVAPESEPEPKTE
jgi:hypothetical protein